MAMSVLLQDVFHYYKKYDEFSKCVSISVLKPPNLLYDFCYILTLFENNASNYPKFSFDYTKVLSVQKLIIL